jgi:ADP-heptose:LPS heptosyltransferase
LTLLFKTLIKGLISVFGIFTRPLIQSPGEVRKPERIAILLWGGIGNHILFSPALYAIRNRFPNAEIAICSFQHFAEELFSQTGDHFVAVGENPSVRSIGRMFFLIRNYKPDVVIANAMSPTFLSSLVAYLSGARIRVGIDRYCRGCLNNIRIKAKKGHEVELNLSLAESLIGTPAEPILRVDFTHHDEEIAEKAFQNTFGSQRKKPCIAIQPGSGRMQLFKRWEKEKFRQLIEKLLRMGATVVVLGTKEEQEEIAFIQRAIKHTDLKLIRSHLTLPQILLVLKHLDLVIANDTSLVHLAAVSGVPSVVIYGPTDPEKNEPWQVSSRIVRKEMSCSPCYRYAMPHCRQNYSCLRDVTVAEVFNAVKEILEEKKPQVSHLDINKLLEQ